MRINNHKTEACISVHAGQLLKGMIIVNEGVRSTVESISPKESGNYNLTDSTGYTESIHSTEIYNVIANSYIKALADNWSETIPFPSYIGRPSEFDLNVCQFCKGWDAFGDMKQYSNTPGGCTCYNSILTN